MVVGVSRTLRTIKSLKAVRTLDFPFLYNLCFIEFIGHNYQYDNNGCNGDNASNACNGHIGSNGSNGCNIHK